MSIPPTESASRSAESPELMAALSRIESKLAYIEYDIARRRHLPPISVWRIGWGVAMGLFIAAVISTLVTWLIGILLGFGVLATLKALTGLQAVVGALACTA